MTVSQFKPPGQSTCDPPSTLSAPARVWWSKLTVEFDLTDAAAQLILETALTSWDRAQLADRQIKRDGLTVKGANGGIKAHPLLAVSREAIVAFNRAMRALNLDVEPLQDKPGRPPRLPQPMKKGGYRDADQ